MTTFQHGLEAKSIFSSRLRFATKNSPCQLVCTRSRLATAGVAKQFRSNIFGSHPLTKFGNSLEVPVAATGKADVADFVAIAGELDCGGTCAPGFERFFHENTCLMILFTPM